MLILGSDINLVVAEKSIHKRKDLTTGTIIYDLVDKRGQKVVFQTSFVNVPIIDTNSYTPTFLIDWYRVRNPFCQSHGINKTGFKKFFNFEFNGCSFAWMDRTEALSYWFGTRVCFNLMHNDRWVDTWHLFVTPGKNITKFLE
jgi:hypothetical protein